MRLFVLDYGLFEVFENGRVIGIPGFLIAGGTHIIAIDSGFPPRYAVDPAGAAQADGLDSFGRVLALTFENLPAAQLARAGFAPEQVTHLVLTHTHIDHVGGIDAFPKATLVVGAAERALEQPLYWPGGRGPAWPRLPYQAIERDTKLVPGVTLLATPGHSPGHLSLLVELPETGPVLLTGDAVNRADEVEQDDYRGAWDPQQARRSTRRLAELAEHTGATIIYGHDPAQWRRLRKAPQFYE